MKATRRRKEKERENYFTISMAKRSFCDSKFRIHKRNYQQQKTPLHGKKQHTEHQSINDKLGKTCTSHIITDFHKL